jgi:outer membrane lipoprotein-sorting protein
MMPSRRALIALLAAAPLAAAAQAPRATALSEQDRADIARIEAYLNAMRTLEARFVQIAESGATAEGRVQLARPGRMRLEYDPPVPLLVVAFGGQIIQYDKELKQATYLPLSATPAAILLRDQVRLSGDVTVTKLERGANALRVTLVQTADPRAGQLTLVFGDRPLQLTSWIVVDAQGQSIRVALAEIRNDVPLDPQLFTFREPGAFPGNRN